MSKKFTTTISRSGPVSFFIDGSQVTKDVYEQGLREAGWQASEPDPHRTVEQPGQPPRLVCACGNETFHITYGAYECIAWCDNCGRKGIAYDG